MTANSSETEVAFVEEVTWGVTPATPAFQRMRITGETLTHSKETIRSEEINPNADVVDEIDVGASGTGDLNFELNFGDEDTGVIMAHALRSDWVGGTGGDDLEDLVAGTAKKSMTIEKRFELGATDDFSRFEGMRTNTLNFSVDANGLVTCTAGFIGKQEVTDTAIITGATYNAANTGRPMSAPLVANIAIAGVSGTIYYSALSLSINNNCAAQNALSNNGAIGVRYGQREITGTLSAYLDTNARQVYELFKAGTKGQLSFDLADDQGDTYTFTMPQVAFTEGSKQATGNNEDVIIEASFTAFYDATLGSALRIQRTASGA